MAVKQVRLKDSRYKKYHLCRENEDCWELGYRKELGGGCYYETSLYHLTHDNDDPDREEFSYAADHSGASGEFHPKEHTMIKVCKVNLDSRVTGGSSTCLKDDDCPIGYFCDPTLFQCHFISDYGDPCRRPSTVFLPLQNVPSTELETDSTVPQKKALHGNNTVEIVTAKDWQNANSAVNDVSLVPFLRNESAEDKRLDFCPSQLACHPEIGRCLGKSHIVQKTKEGQIICSDKNDCPISHFCSNALPGHQAEEKGVCLPRQVEENGVCYISEQCPLGFGCEKDISLNSGNSEPPPLTLKGLCHRRCYMNLDCLPSGHCTGSDGFLGYCYGNKPVKYVDKKLWRWQNEVAKPPSDSSTWDTIRGFILGESWDYKTWLIIAGSILCLAIILSSMLVFFYKRRKHKKKQIEKKRFAWLSRKANNFLST